MVRLFDCWGGRLFVREIASPFGLAMTGRPEWNRKRWKVTGFTWTIKSNTQLTATPNNRGNCLLKTVISALFQDSVWSISIRVPGLLLNDRCQFIVSRIFLAFKTKLFNG